MATELERLVAVFEADITRFDKRTTELQRLFDQRASQIERRQKTLQDKLNAGWNFSGFNSFLAKLGVGISVGGIVAGLRSIVAEADRLKDTSDQLNITTQDLQGLRAAALATGASVDVIDRGLATLTDNLGDAEQGTGKLYEVMKRNHIQLGTTMQVLMGVADAVKNAHSWNEKMAISTAAFGRAGKALIPILNEGADGIQRQFEAAQQSGQIWDPKVVADLDRAADAWKRIGTAIEGTVAGPLADFLDMISRISKTDWQAILLGASSSDPGGANSWQGILLGATQRHDAAGAGAALFGTNSGAGGAVGTGLAPSPRGALPPPHGGDSAAEKAIRLERERQQAIARTLAAAIAAEAEETRATDAANLARTEGTAAYYAAAIKAANDDLTAEIAAIKAKEAEDIASLKRRELGESAYQAAVANIRREAAAKQGAAQQRADQATEAARRPLIDAIRDAEEHNAALQQEIGTVGLYGAALAEAQMRLELLNAAKRTGIPISAEEAQKIDALAVSYGQWTEKLQAAQREEQRNVQLADGVRQGVEDIGVAAAFAAGDFEGAVKRELLALAELYFRLKVLKPLIESVLGPEGTTGGGLFDFFGTAGAKPGPGAGGIDFSAGGIPGFAGGGDPPVGRPFVVGEHGPEIMRVKSPVRVTPRIPRLPTVPTAVPAMVQQINVAPTFNVDARGAQQGVAEQIDAKMRAFVPAILAQAKRNARDDFAGNLHRTYRDVA